MPPSATLEALGRNEMQGDPSVARELASLHRKIRRTGEPFLSGRDLDEMEGVFAVARQRFRDEQPEDPSVRAAGEWLLDNDYVVRRVLGQLRREFPSEFQRRLPRLVEDGRPRALAVAEAIYDGTPREFDVEELECFLDAYQELASLTIAELWALPALLRLVILRRFGTVMERTLGDDRESPSSIDPGSAAGRAVRALRLLADVDWKQAFCSHSSTERLLSEDPAGAYAEMVGLAITQKILELHDRTIDVASVLDSGTTFSFQLPVEPSA